MVQLKLPKRLAHPLESKPKESVRLFDPFRRTLENFIHIGLNPYIKEVAYYLENVMFPTMIEAVDSMTPEGVDVDLEFIWEKDWFVKANSIMTIMTNRLYNGIPEELVGGKAEFKVLINNEGVPFTLKVEWEDDNMTINLGPNTIQELIDNKSIYEDPTTWEGDGPNRYKMVGNTPATENAGPQLDEQLKHELVIGLQGMGMKKGELDMGKINTIVSKDWGDINYTEKLSKSLTQYFFRG